MGLREDVLAILRGSIARHMSFTMPTMPNLSRISYSPTITVNGSTFERVAVAIETGRVTLVQSTDPDEDNASYDGHIAGNPFEVHRTRNHRMAEAIILHEAVHASLDLTHSSIPRIDNEVAAYIAGTIYLRRMGFPRARYAGTFEQDALTAANAIISGRAVTASELQPLRTALENDTQYRAAIHWGCTVGTQCYYIDRYDG